MALELHKVPISNATVDSQWGILLKGVSEAKDQCATQVK